MCRTHICTIKSEWLHQYVRVITRQSWCVRTTIQLHVRQQRQRTYRPITPNHHVNFQKYVSTEHVYDTSSESDTQKQFDKFYSTTLSLLNQFYPEKTVAVRFRDPAYMTADIKTKLRKKNHLMRAGRWDEARVLAVQVGNDITRQNKICLKHTSSRTQTFIRPVPNIVSPKLTQTSGPSQLPQFSLVSWNKLLSVCF